MREFKALLLGSVLAYSLVLNPMRAKLLASIASVMPETNASTFNLYNYALSYDSCNIKILTIMGDIALSQKNGYAALASYGHAILCSPANALIRAKYGEVLLLTGYNGLFSLKEAALLEPNNTFYTNELERVTKLQLPSL